MSFEWGVWLEGGSDRGGDNPTKQTLVPFLFLLTPLPFFPLFSPGPLEKSGLADLCEGRGRFLRIIRQAFCEA